MLEAACPSRKFHPCRIRNTVIRNRPTARGLAPYRSGDLDILAERTSEKASRIGSLRSRTARSIGVACRPNSTQADSRFGRVVYRWIYRGLRDVSQKPFATKVRRAPLRRLASRDSWRQNGETEKPAQNSSSPRMAASCQVSDPTGYFVGPVRYGILPRMGDQRPHRSCPTEGRERSVEAPYCASQRRGPHQGCSPDSSI